MEEVKNRIENHCRVTNAKGIFEFGAQSGPMNAPSEKQEAESAIVLLINLMFVVYVLFGKLRGIFGKIVHVN